MSTRQITECDRCHREIGGKSPYGHRDRVDAVVKVTRTDPNTTGYGEKELCETCASKLDQFLGGRELDEPP